MREMKTKRIEDRMPINNHIADLIHESDILLRENRKLKKRLKTWNVVGIVVGFQQ